MVSRWRCWLIPGEFAGYVARATQGPTGTKKGCDQGHCGARMVLVNGKRVNACLTEAVENAGKQITTIEGYGGAAHPAGSFVKHDAFPVRLLYARADHASAVACIPRGPGGIRASIREYMNDNICRRGAYPNIVAAIWKLKTAGRPSDFLNFSNQGI